MRSFGLSFSFFALLVFLTKAPLSQSNPIFAFHSRRSLHQPFFPHESSPPPFELRSPSPSPSLSPFPSPSPSPSPSFPQFSPPIPIPFSSNAPPFFPFYTSPPPPPPLSNSLPTFPANVSSLVIPNYPSSKHKSPKIAIAILLPLPAVSILVLIAFFVFRHQRRSFVDKTCAADGHRLFSADAPSSSNSHKDGAGSEFLYLGTVVSSRGVNEAQDGDSGTADPNSSYKKLGSPELHPLPPLSRNFVQNYRKATGAGREEDEEEEFYSPGGSPGGRTFEAVAADSCGMGSSNSATSSYSSSNSTSSILSLHSNSNSPSTSFDSIPHKSNSASRVPASYSNSIFLSTSNCANFPRNKSLNLGSTSPERPETKSLCSPSDRIVGSAPLQPPRPRTPSPPKRKPPLPSPPCSPPPEKKSDKNPILVDRISAASGQSQWPEQIVNFSRHPFKKPSLPLPPPLPPTGYWDNPVAPWPTDWSTSRPPVLVKPSRTSHSKNPIAVSPAESLENSGASERCCHHTRPKLKPLHWDKVRASSDSVTVWDKLKSASFQMNEEMIETLFVCNTANSFPKETINRRAFPGTNQENGVLDPKKSQNIAILLRALNVTNEEVCEALLEGYTDGLGTELLETLLKMAPTEEEEVKLKECKDDSPSKLGPAENFLKAVLDIPFAFKRIDTMLYITNFDSEVKCLKTSFETIEAACKELRSSRMFLKLLEAVLKAGNRMNVGSNRGDAQAFKLDTLLKLVDVKGTDGKTTLLHFVVQEIIRYEGSHLSGTNQLSTSKTQQHNFHDDVELRKVGLQVVAGLNGELNNVKKAAAMDSDVLSSYVLELAGGIGKVAEVMRLNDIASTKDSNPKFSFAMNEFLKKAKEEIMSIQAQENVTLSLVKEITEYFHGNSAKEEAHPFRIFMVVRDFLPILDQVCKEVGKVNERLVINSALQFSAVHQSLPLEFLRFHMQQVDSFEGDSSLSP